MEWKKILFQKQDLDLLGLNEHKTSGLKYKGLLKNMKSLARNKE